MAAKTKWAHERGEIFPGPLQPFYVLTHARDGVSASLRSPQVKKWGKIPALAPSEARWVSLDFRCGSSKYLLEVEGSEGVRTNSGKRRRLHGEPPL